MEGSPLTSLVEVRALVNADANGPDPNSEGSPILSLARLKFGIPLEEQRRVGEGDGDDVGGRRAT